MPLKILVLDAAQRSALAVTRSLGKVAHITTAEAAPLALAGASRFSTNFVQCPSPEYEPSAFLQWIIAFCRENRFDWVIPVTEITSQLLLMNEANLSSLKLPFADYATVMRLANKGHLVELANSLGIPCPSSQLFASSDALDTHSLKFPCVLKPCLSKIFEGNHWIATSVRVLHSKEDLDKVLLKDAYLKNYPFMIQEFIPGHGAGVFCLYNHGKPAAFFAHQRLREKPPQGGISVFSQSVAIDPLLKKYAMQLLESVRWHGVAMVEYRIAPDGTPYLMEVNTRFWGSLQLAIDAGVDFPQLLIQMDKNCDTSPVNEYRIGQRLRWVLGDIDSLYLFLKSGYSVKEKLIRLAQFCTPHLFHCRHEVNRFSDLYPAWFELKTYIKNILGR